MRREVRFAGMACLAGLICVAAVPSAHASSLFQKGWGFLSDGFPEGRWRVEVAAADASLSNKWQRDGDWFAVGNIEYEWPCHPHMMLGLRGFPLFVYSQREPRETLWGAGIGVAPRFYFSDETYAGWFLEGGAAMLVHDGLLNNNSSHVNFLLEAGLGYQFENRWHTAFKFYHISNGGIASRNAGTNGLGLAVGYTF